MRHSMTLLLAAALAVGAFPGFGADPALAASGTEGFLYGEVETRSGNTYVGRLRWGKEEAFWGDHFNSSKENRPFAEDAPGDHRRREGIEIFGVEIGVRWSDHDGGRQFIAPFGSLEKLEISGREEFVATMKGGTEIELDGGSNDVGATVRVWDDSLGEIGIDWDEIDRVVFRPTPADLDVDGVHRLYGIVRTDDERTFTGWIQWDKDECLSTDELDGKTRDGNLAIEFGRIRSIERRSRSSSRVTLLDGRELVLDGTNDVNDDNRGIFVEDPRWGRVLVNWDAFDRIDFEIPKSSGPAYSDYPPGEPLRGTVEIRRGEKHSGRIVWDLDEEETWELLNGEWRDVEYSIPFWMIAAIEPRGHSSSRVILRNGEEIELEDSADVDDGNAGIAIVDDGRTTYLEWDDLERVQFE